MLSNLFRPADGDGSPSLRVLVVNDDRDTADTFADVAELWGHAVRVAHDGPAAVLAAREYHPEVVLLDLDRPGTADGELARALRGEPGQDGMLLVAFTSHDRDNCRRAREAGINHCLTKPVDPEALRRLLTPVAVA